MWDGLLSLVGRKVVIMPHDYFGLGNRIKFLASYHVNFGLDGVTLFWSRKGWVDRPFSDLFHLDSIQGFRERAVPRCRLIPMTCYPCAPEFRSRGYWRLHVGSHEVPKDMFMAAGGAQIPVVDFAYERTPPALVAKYSKFFNLLRPSPAVQTRIEEVPLGEQVVCVHIRNSRDPRDRKDVAELDRFRDIMKSYSNTTAFFISTMDPAVSRRFQADFPGRVYELPGKDHRSMVDAVADIYLLSRGRELIASPGSTFSEVAWWLGGCGQRVLHMPRSYTQ